MRAAPALWFILATILIDAVGVGLIFPLMPDLMARVGAGSTADGALWGGVLMAAYAFMQFLFAPAIGAASDMLGRKPVLLLALATLVVDYVIMALAGTFWLLLLGRALAGIAGATYITATAYIADISPPELRAARFGLIGATFGIGFVLGPAIGGLLAGIDLSAPFWLAAGLAALNLGFGLFVLPESLQPEKRRPMALADLNPLGAIRDAFRLPGLAVPLVALFVFEFANMVYPTLWAFLLRERFAWSAALIGASLAAYGVGVALVQAGLLPRLVTRLGEGRTLRLSWAFGIVGLIGFGLAPEAWMIWALLPLATLSDMVPPLMTSLMSAQVGEDRQGLLQGVIASLGSVAAVVAPIGMTALFAAFSDERGLYAPGAPFLAGAVMLGLVLPLVLRLTRRRVGG